MDLVRAYDAGAFVVTPHHAQRLAVSAALGPLAARCTIDTVERMQAASGTSLLFASRDWICTVTTMVWNSTLYMMLVELLWH